MTLALVGGLLVLVIGAELLVRGSSRLARAFGVPSLIIGLTIVAFGTSAPELVVSMKAAWGGSGDIAFGNVVGSNTFNILFILGISALIIPLSVHSRLLRIDTPIMIGVAVACLLVGLDGVVSRWEGVGLLAALSLYVVLQVRGSRSKSLVSPEFDQEFGKMDAPTAGRVMLDLGVVVGGLVLLVFGAKWFVDGATALARSFGVSELVIGLTVVAAGTSLPEVATSILAAIRGERDIAVGNVVGSNIFNVLGVLGTSATIAPVKVAESALVLDVPVMIVASVACIPVFVSGRVIARWEGAVFLAYYVAYTVHIVLRARGYQLTGPLGFVFAGVAVSLTLVTLAVLATRRR